MSIHMLCYFFIGLIGFGVYSSPLYMLNTNPLLRMCVTMSFYEFYSHLLFFLTMISREYLNYQRNYSYSKLRSINIIKKKKKRPILPKAVHRFSSLPVQIQFCFFFEAMVILCKMEHVLELAAFFMLVIVQRAWARKSQRHRFKSWLCAHQLST